ncbi:MAG TPA: hypothetical protein VD978_33710 [Azospirillum sp.]|nr:hypothetical protein [Azospirillum sp.]
MQFHHHPDNLIYLRGARTYMAQVAEFAADLVACGLPAYAGLPEGATERRYDGGRHLVGYGERGFEDAEPWPEGDAYLAALDALLAARAARLNPEPPLESVKAAAERSIDTRAGEARAAFVSVGAYLDEEYQRVAAQADACLSGAPGPFATLEADVEAGTFDPRLGRAVETEAEAADLVRVTRAAWLTKLDEIRRVRLTAKADIRAAQSAEEVATILAGLEWPQP